MSHELRQASPQSGLGAPGVSVASALNANVLVLNRYYQAIRVINVRRAFSLLCRELAEVIHIEKDSAGESRACPRRDLENRERIQVPTLRMTNPSTSSKVAYDATVQFAWIFPVMRRDTLDFNSRRYNRITLLFVAPRR